MSRQESLMKFLTTAIALFIIALILVLSPGCSSSSSGPSQNNVPPITEDLFPLVAGHQFSYTGYLVDKDSVKSRLAGQPTPYKATWTIAPGPSGTWVIVDSTKVGGTLYPTKLFQIKKDADGSFWFRQTLGPFYRAVQASYTDTAIWVLLAKPSVGLNVLWVAYDTTVTGVVNGVTSSIHFQIYGNIEAKEVITDSSSTPAQDTTYRVHTYRKVTVSGFSVQQTTAYLWLQPNVGPVQIDIAGDPENYGHFRVLTDRNF